MKTTKTIPTFESEAEEREFWENHDTTEYFDTSKAKMVYFSNLKKSTKSISIRLPENMLNELKVKANSMDIPYQSFIKMLLQEGLVARRA